VCRDAAEVPARTWTEAPELPRRIVTPVAVTVCGRVSSSPVPGFRLPNAAVVYQSLRQGDPGSPDSASPAWPGLSPSYAPPGPTAVTLDGVTWRIVAADEDGAGVEGGAVVAGGVVGVAGADGAAPFRGAPGISAAPESRGPEPAASW
jgi:hypothetical protein